MSRPLLQPPIRSLIPSLRQNSRGGPSPTRIHQHNSGTLPGVAFLDLGRPEFATFAAHRRIAGRIAPLDFRRNAHPWLRLKILLGRFDKLVRRTGRKGRFHAAWLRASAVGKKVSRRRHACCYAQLENRTMSDLRKQPDVPRMYAGNFLGCQRQLSDLPNKANSSKSDLVSGSSMT
jgi:hypothetical protein